MGKSFPEREPRESATKHGVLAWCSPRPLLALGFGLSSPWNDNFSLENHFREQFQVTCNVNIDFFSPPKYCGGPRVVYICKLYSSFHFWTKFRAGWFQNWQYTAFPAKDVPSTQTLCFPMNTGNSHECFHEHSPNTPVTESLGIILISALHLLSSTEVWQSPQAVNGHWKPDSMVSSVGHQWR